MLDGTKSAWNESWLPKLMGKLGVDIGFEMPTKEKYGGASGAYGGMEQTGFMPQMAGTTPGMGGGFGGGESPNLAAPSALEGSLAGAGGGVSIGQINIVPPPASESWTDPERADFVYKEVGRKIDEEMARK